MEAPRPLAVRRGLAVGLLMLAVLTPVVVANSSTPFLALIETLVAGLTGVIAVGLVATAINRRRARPGLRTSPRLNVRRAVGIGLAVGVLVDAALSARSADPLAAFFLNVALVLWIAALLAAALLVVERRNVARRLRP